MSERELIREADRLARLVKHINGPKHGGPFEETNYAISLGGNEALQALDEWHLEEHEAAALLEADDLSEGDPFSGTEAMLAHVLTQHSGTGTGTWLEQLDEVHEEEHLDPVTQGDSGHTHVELKGE